MNQLLPYFLLLAASLVAAFFVHRMPPSGGRAALCSLVPLLGYYLTQQFC
jgi:hypothetical protein